MMFSRLIPNTLRAAISVIVLRQAMLIAGAAKAEDVTLHDIATAMQALPQTVI